MAINPQTSQNVEIVTKKEITIRTVLNIYGVFAVIGLILSIFTAPITLSENMNLYFNEEIMMGEKTIKDFLVFIISSAVVYFSFVNLYYKFLIDSLLKN
ncbi:hypothetical protein [Litchfieldia alkalitelluris]|uniref:hypothetical protein n=1 Tax=Litchfieldia alkalitelluris TaxID=304268 RepID=UPI0009984BDF|nr:hypothetical protein [Litchfieldia alkalitelluris]